VQMSVVASSAMIHHHLHKGCASTQTSDIVEMQKRTGSVAS